MYDVITPKANFQIFTTRQHDKNNCALAHLITVVSLVNHLREPAQHEQTASFPTVKWASVPPNGFCGKCQFSTSHPRLSSFSPVCPCDLSLASVFAISILTFTVGDIQTDKPPDIIVFRPLESGALTRLQCISVWGFPKEES